MIKHGPSHVISERPSGRWRARREERLPGWVPGPTGCSQLALFGAREGSKGLVAACHARFDLLHCAGHTGQQFHAAVGHHDVLLDTDLARNGRHSVFLSLASCTRLEGQRGPFSGAVCPAPDGRGWPPVFRGVGRRGGEGSSHRAICSCHLRTPSATDQEKGRARVLVK